MEICRPTSLAILHDVATGSNRLGIGLIDRPDLEDVAGVAALLRVAMGLPSLGDVKTANHDFTPLGVTRKLSPVVLASKKSPAFAPETNLSVNSTCGIDPVSVRFEQ